MNAQEKELDLLETLARGRAGLNQRDLSRVIGLSLGMTNSIIKRLARKGWLKIRKVNNRNIQYIISPQGMQKIAGRSYRYLRRTIKNVVYYKDAISDFISGLAKRGFSDVVLVGPSDIDFLVEHACGRNGCRFVRVDSFDEAAATREPGSSFLLLSEEIDAEELVEWPADCEALSRILTAM